MKRAISILGLLALPVQAIEIELDYSHDEAAHDFFTANPKAKSALEKAAEDLGSVLSQSLNQISSDLYTATNGGTQARFDWSLNYINPVTGTTQTITDPRADSDTVIVYAGTRSISSDSTLGRGGLGGASASLSPAGSPAPHEWIDAVIAAETASNNGMRRGGGPIVNTISGAADWGSYKVSYDLDFGVTVGNLWFDADTDNNGSRDSMAQLENFWHFDATTPVAAGKMDFYSVALHELLHTIGVGTSSTWESLTSGTTWNGAEASSIHGTNQLISADGHHVLAGLMSTRLSDGVVQESVLSPSITPGARKELTELDLAILKDLGFKTEFDPVPEPASVILLALASSFLPFFRQRRV